MSDYDFIILTSINELNNDNEPNGKIAIKIRDILWIFNREGRWKPGSMIRLNDVNEKTIFVYETMEEILNIISEKTGTK